MHESVCEQGGPDPGQSGRAGKESGFHSEFTPTLWGVRSQKDIRASSRMATAGIWLKEMRGVGRAT